MTEQKTKQQLFFHDLLLILTMAVLAGCGLIYEYLLSHYAGRILGVMESAIYTMIGLMIVAMGLGAFAARKIKCAFNGFVWLEIAIAFIGTLAILFIGAAVAFSQVLPQVISDTFNLPPDVIPQGGWLKQVSFLAFKSPYAFGLLLGFLIGMEIPLIAKIREHIHQKHLSNNLGTIYGADYVGAGIGAAIWVIFLLSIDISKASALTAALNIVAGTVFVIFYWKKLSKPKAMITCHALLVVIAFWVYQNGNQWLNHMSNFLYLDKVVYTDKTRYQQLTFTERKMGMDQGSVINFYLNGRLQFSSSDEHIYHSYLVMPALAASARQDNVLIIGGGDGLALRDVLAWQPNSVTLVDLDKELIDIFKNPADYLPARLARQLSTLVDDSLTDKRVTIINDDAFLAVNNLIKQGQHYDTIIVDLPDPSHPDLNKLYSVHFYAKLNQLLVGDGAISIQSTSPYHAKDAFITVKNTLAAAGFPSVEQYHDNVPSFGEWGWTIATKMGASPSTRLNALDQLPIDHHWLNLAMVKSAFIFPTDFYQGSELLQANYLGSHRLYQLHQHAWRDQQGLNSTYLQQ